MNRVLFHLGPDVEALLGVQHYELVGHLKEINQRRVAQHAVRNMLAFHLAVVARQLVCHQTILR